MQLMIYETAVPVSHARHGNWSLEVGTNYAFCRNIKSVPVMAAEFASAALEYAVVFGGTGDAVMPVTVLGVRTNENLYVTKDGGWHANYIPAFVRRYPFVFASGDESKTFTLCID
jgi:SapC